MKVLYIYPFGPFHPISSGSDITASNHLEYFRQKRWDVDCCTYQITEKAGYLFQNVLNTSKKYLSKN